MYTHVYIYNKTRVYNFYCDKYYAYLSKNRTCPFYERQLVTLNGRTS